MAQHPTYGNGKICYLELPSRDIAESIKFYTSVFAWQTRKRGDGSAAFDDAVRINLPELTARFTDPTGNIPGLYQERG